MKPLDAFPLRPFTVSLDVSTVVLAVREVVKLAKIFILWAKE
jgi:hypothetical protein